MYSAFVIVAPVSAVHKSGLVHYAGGTDVNGRLMHDTLAIVNDAKQGPRQEAIVTDTNDVFLPRGKDVPVMLQKGWGVLNGTQTQQLGLSHFANGTGLFTTAVKVSVTF